jgi:hypothetical protein
MIIMLKEKLLHHLRFLKTFKIGLVRTLTKEKLRNEFLEIKLNKINSLTSFRAIRCFQQHDCWRLQFIHRSFPYTQFNIQNPTFKTSLNHRNRLH